MSKIISSLNKIGISTNGLNKNDILNLGEIPEDKLNAYTQKISSIKNANLSKLNNDKTELYQSLQIKQYANALSELTPLQQASLLKTQELTNAQIKQILAVQNLSTAEQYQAMAEAGLLAKKREITNVELQSTLTRQLGSKARAEETMAVMGLTVAQTAEEAQTVKVSNAKIEKAYATGVLTKAESEELAMTLGVTASKGIQFGQMPQWISQMKALTQATWAEVKATAIWMAPNPAGWAMALVAGIGVAVVSVKGINKIIDKCREKVIEAEKTASDTINYHFFLSDKI